MKKITVFLLTIFIILFCISNVNASFLDDIFSGESEGNEFDFVDMGIEGNNSSDWYFLKTLKVSVTDKGTVLTNIGDGNTFYSANKPSTPMNNSDDVFDWNAPYTVEFDLISGNQSGLQIINKDNSSSRTFEQLGVTSGSHIKVVNDGNAIKYYINGVNDPTYIYNTSSLNNTAIRFAIPPNDSLTYKNFTITHN